MTHREYWLVLYYLLTNIALYLDDRVGAAVLILGLVIFRRTLVSRVIRHITLPWRRINRDAHCVSQPAIDSGPTVALLTCSLVVVLLNYCGGRQYFVFLFRTLAAVFPGFAAYGDPRHSLAAYAYWSIFRILVYVGIPALALRFVEQAEFRDCGLSGNGFIRHLWLYIGLYLVVLPPVIVMSTRASFQRVYPFYKKAIRSWPHFAAWEVLYALQFFALEFFYRGFTLHLLRSSFGAYSILVMAIPYGMIHFAKPLPEALGSIVAAIMLGTLSMTTRSIWGGVLIHITVAITMDSLSIIQQTP